MADSSFDVVSKIDRQEVANALNQAAKELSQRYDFRGTNTTVEFSGEDKVVLTSDAEERVKAGLEVFQEKLIKRNISLKAFDTGDKGPQLSGKEYRLEGVLKEGLAGENAKKVTKLIRDEGPKGVKSQIQGDELRVQSKSRDDLQEVQRLLKAADLDVDLQYTNYR